jgi:hypothetical protein
MRPTNGGFDCVDREFSELDFCAARAVFCVEVVKYLRRRMGGF